MRRKEEKGEGGKRENWTDFTNALFCPFLFGLNPVSGVVVRLWNAHTSDVTDIVQWAAPELRASPTYQVREVAVECLEELWHQATSVTGTCLAKNCFKHICCVHI